MPDPILTYMVDRLLTDATVGPAVQGRVHTGHIFDVAQPEYPMVTVQRLAMGEADSLLPVSSFVVMMTAFSVTSYDEAFELLQAAKPLFNWVRATVSGHYFIFNPWGTPVQGADRTERQVYWYSLTFEVNLVTD